MGDMADFALDSACDECEDYDRFSSGYYTPQEAYDRGFINELGGEEKGSKGWNTLFHNNRRYSRTNVGVSCKHCFQSNLRWKQHSSGKYWLTEADGSWHKCDDED